jgi:hypothetical protein
VSALLLTAAFSLIAYKARTGFAVLFPLGLLGVLAADIILTGHGLEDQPFRTRLLAAAAGCLAGLALHRPAVLTGMSRAEATVRPALSLPLQLGRSGTLWSGSGGRDLAT